MRAYVATPNYHPDDKDILDFLHASKPSTKDLQRFLAGRCIYMSPILSLDAQYQYVSQLPLNWSQCETLLSLEKLRPRSESWSSSDFKTPLSDAEIDGVLQDLVKHRSEKEKEQYKITKLENGVTSVLIKYQDINYEKTRVFQQIDEETQLRIEPIKGGYRLLRKDDDRSPKIERTFEGLLEEEAISRKKKFESNRILISKLGSARLRTEFFFSLMKGIEGGEFEDLTSLRVRRMGAEDTETEEDEEVAEANKQQIKAAMFSGSGLLTSNELQSFLDAGFYLHSTEWFVTTSNDDLARCFYKAGFIQTGDDYYLSFKATHVASRVEGEIEPKRRPAEPTQMRLLEKIRNSADVAYSKVLADEKV